jgi:hypothetical protein
MNSDTSSEKEHGCKEYIEHSPKSTQWTTDDTKECTPNVEVIANAHQFPLNFNDPEKSITDKPDTFIQLPPPDGGLHAWSQAICAHLVSQLLIFI